MSQSDSLELHVWGPAFGLPSFDTNCLAAILYVHHALPDQNWQLVSSDPNRNPFRQLPALHHDGTWVAGFEQIQEYLSHISHGAYDLDRNLNNVQEAKRDAYTAFLYSKGVPLLDLSLYVSTENYNAATRRALSELLAWPQSWIIPHQLRDQAKRRSDHLGMSALDVDAAQENKEDTGLSANIPKSLRIPKQTVSGLLGRPAQATRFRLDALTDDFLEPLQGALAGKQWLVADKISSVDCLAIAIISLMEISDVPQAWLCEALSSKYSGVGLWSKKNTPAEFAVSRSSADVMDSGSTVSLPWAADKRPALTWVEKATFTIETAVNNLPLLRRGYEHNEIPQQNNASTSHFKDRQQMYRGIRDQQSRYSQIVMACVGATSLVGWMVHAGVLTLSHVYRRTPARKSFGEAGAILGL